MPRTARAAKGGYCCHVMNRGNGRAEVFHKRLDYAGFARLLRAGVARTGIRLVSYCLMPNHTGSSSCSGSSGVGGIDFREVRRLISIQQVLDLLRFVSVEKNGAQVRGPCPLHGSSSESSRVFSVSLSKNTFQCFKCGAAGNHLDLWARATNQRLYDAALDLCRRLHCDVPWLKAEQR